MSHHELLFLWKRAANSEFGIAIKTPPEDLRTLQTALYEARRGFKEYGNVSICMVEGEAWLVKDTVRLTHGAARRTDPEGAS